MICLACMIHSQIYMIIYKFTDKPTSHAFNMDENKFHELFLECQKTNISKLKFTILILNNITCEILVVEISGMCMCVICKSCVYGNCGVSI